MKMDLTVTRERVLVVRRMMVMVIATMLSTMLVGIKVDAAATCSYLPDTSQLSCR